MSAVFLFLLATLNAQIKTPALWKFSAQKQGNNEYQVKIQVNLPPQWHIYSQNAGKGPVSTQIVFSPNPLIQVGQKTKEIGKLESKFDKSFNSNINYYSNQVVFSNGVSLKAKVKTTLNGYVYYMVCDDSKCLPPTKENFSIPLE